MHIYLRQKALPSRRHNAGWRCTVLLYRRTMVAIHTPEYLAIGCYRRNGHSRHFGMVSDSPYEGRET